MIKREKLLNAKVELARLSWVLDRLDADAERQEERPRRLRHGPPD